jgi:hypothetical protein
LELQLNLYNNIVTYVMSMCQLGILYENINKKRLLFTKKG